jgi:putative phosphoesterase
MVRLILLADIHSNIVALKEVLAHAGSADKIICAGDIVGYNPWPNECIHMIQKMNIDSVMGNHDLASATDIATEFNPYAEVAVHFTHKQLTKNNLLFISNLPERLEFKIDNVKICVYHGSPRDPISEYVFPTTPEKFVRSLLDQSGGDVLILGHTHIPMIFNFDGRYVVNPGGVGQPRDGNPRASYMALNVDQNKVTLEHYRVEYNIDMVAHAIRAFGLPKMLADRLYRGF